MISSTTTMTPDASARKDASRGLTRRLRSASNYNIGEPKEVEKKPEDGSLELETGGTGDDGAPTVRVDDPDECRKETPWQEQVSYTERAKIRLARAFIMTPEVLVVHRTLNHFNAKTQ